MTMITVNADMTTAVTMRHRMKRLYRMIPVLCLVFGLGCSTAENTDVPAEHPQVAIEIENFGTITVELDPEAAPLTVENFLTLVDEGFYDGLTFHRIIEGFMMQGGASYTQQAEMITGEFASNGWKNPIKHERGVISMARAQDPDSASSQFFIVQQDAPHLDGEYAAFGHVISGMEIVDAVCSEAEPVDNNGTIAPEAQPKIISIRRVN